MSPTEAAEMLRLKTVVDEIQRELHPWVAKDKHMVFGLQHNITKLSNIISEMKNTLEDKIKRIENR